MSSLSVTLTGTNAAALVCDFFPPIELTDGEWYVGLLDFTTYNSIPNVVEGENNELPVLRNGTTWDLITLPTGAYEIGDIEAFLKKKLGDAQISLRPNNNTLKCELTCAFDIDFQQTQCGIGKMLGFTKKQRLEANKTHTSDAPVNIIKVNSILIGCNIVHGSYKNGKNEHTLHSFYPSVEPGFKIIESPTNVVYLPVNVRRLDNITLSLRDQDGDAIDFRGEVITVRLHLKRL